MAEARNESAEARATLYEVPSERARPHVFLGFLLIVIGLIALGSLTVTSVITTMFFGWLFIIGGIIQIGSVFFVSGHRFARTIIGLLFGILGLIVVTNPGLSLATFTLFLAFIWTIGGAIRVLSAFFDQEDGSRGWSIAGGVATFLLGVLVWIGWPVSSLYIVALFVGIDFVIAGLMLATQGTWRTAPPATVS